MRKLIIASAIALITYGSAIKTNLPSNKVLAQTEAQSEASRNGRVKYDYTCNYLRDQDNLQNSITLYGPKVVLVNLDDRCQVEKFERHGIFLQEGDMIFVTGRENALAG